MTSQLSQPIETQLLFESKYSAETSMRYTESTCYEYLSSLGRLFIHE